MEKSVTEIVFPSGGGEIPVNDAGTICNQSGKTSYHTQEWILDKGTIK